MSRRGDAPKRVFYMSEFQSGENSLYVEGDVNGFACRMIVDTGANVTIISPEIAKSINQSLISVTPSATLKTATGDSITVRGKMHVNIRFSSKWYSHQVFVAEILDQCILGVDFLRKYGFTVDMKNNEIYADTEDIVLFGSKYRKIDSPHIFAIADCQVPPRTEVLIEGKASMKKPFRFGVTEHPPESKSSLLVASTLVDLTKKIVPVRIANFSNRPREIKMGEHIASCIPATGIVRSCGVTNGKLTEDPLAELMCNTDLDSKQLREANLLVEEFRDLFSKSSTDVGRTKLAQHRIDIGDHSPIKQHPRRLPFAKRKEVQTLLEEMESNDIIEPSISPWASPIVLVKKKDGSTRFCVDYRKLNDVTKKDSYPLPRIDDTLDNLAGYQWFSTIDLKSGYWQVEIHPEDREKTAFTTGQGLWQFKVMPFGLCNAPATFERLMETVLKGLSFEACLVYLDDIFIVGKTFEDHLHNLRKVFKKLREANLKLSPSKCNLFRHEVRYLGHIISREGIKTDPEKINAVQRWPAPKDVHQLRSFLGLCTYYRKFVKDFSRIARPLHKLTEAKQKFSWTDECDIAFQKLKSLLTENPILTFPQPDKPFILDTDASKEGLGAVLSQDIDGQEPVIAYFSKSLSKAERNYCVTRKELLAIVKAVEHFHPYLYGRKFVLRTDHASLSWLLNFKNPEGQVARWIQRLQEYDMEIRHRKGSSHGNADALSRRPCAENCKHCSKIEARCEPVIRQVSSTHQWTEESIRDSQVEDPEIRPIISFMESGDPKPTWQDIAPFSPTTKRYWNLWDSLELRNGVLYRRWEDADGKSSRLQLLLPKSRVKEVLQELHSSATGGHFGVTKTLQKVRERFYWAGSRSDVEKWCRACDSCGARKGPQRRTRGRLQRYNVGAPFERIAVDILGPLPRTDWGNKYMLVVMDYFSKWPEVYPVPDQATITVAEALVQNWVSRFGVPLLIHSDQGRNFTSATFKGMCDLLGMKKTQTTPLHPESDGMVERFNRTILNHLSIFVSQNQKDWDSKLPFFLLAYRSATHESTGFSPSQMLMGLDLRLPCDLLFGRVPDTPLSPEEYVERLQERLAKVHHIARERINVASEKAKNRYDLKATAYDFKEGDSVWLWNPKRRKGLSPKLQTFWEGPYKVIKKINDVVVRIQKSSSSRWKTMHINRLAPYNFNTVRGLN